MNFALCLLVLSVISGVIYLLDVLVFEKRHVTNIVAKKTIEYSRSFFPVFVTVLLLRSFLVEPFRIPSGSLEPTLLVGDFLVVNKFAYGVKLPVWEKKIIQVNEAKKGDIVVFRWPPNPSYDYIKRVVGTPGDHVVYHNKVLSINGHEIKQTFVRYTTDPSSGESVSEFQENINGVVHDLFVRTDMPAVDFDVTVPTGHYFMMGDNRDDSADSRFWGFVSDEYLRGKAMAIWMSWNNNTNSIRWSRLFNLIH